MLRTRAVRALLLEVVALQGEAAGAAEPEAAASDDLQLVLRKAERRALLVSAVDALALLVLFVMRDRSETFLVFARSPDALFTAGVVLVAVHLGFRLAQYLQLRRVARALADLPNDPQGRG